MKIRVLLIILFTLPVMGNETDQKERKKNINFKIESSIDEERELAVEVVESLKINEDGQELFDPIQQTDLELDETISETQETQRNSEIKKITDITDIRDAKDLDKKRKPADKAVFTIIIY